MDDATFRNVETSSKGQAMLTRGTMCPMILARSTVIMCMNQSGKEYGTPCMMEQS